MGELAGWIAVIDCKSDMFVGELAVLSHTVSHKHSSVLVISYFMLQYAMLVNYLLNGTQCVCVCAASHLACGLLDAWSLRGASFQSVGTLELELYAHLMWFSVEACFSITFA